MAQKYGSVLVPAGTLGLFPVTAVGFQPSSIAVIVAMETDARVCRGVSGFGGENSFSEEIAGGGRTCLVRPGVIISEIAGAFLSSWDPDGFTLNFLDAPANDLMILYDVRG